MPRGAKPKPDGQKVTRHAMTHPWQPAPGAGWQHGDLPPAPPGLMPESEAAWDAWFRSWWASNWRLEDLPQLVLVVRLFDNVTRGQLDVAKLTPLLDRYGITPKGRQDLRWAPPKEDKPAAEPAATPARRLKVVDSA